MEFGPVCLCLVVAPAPQQRGEGSACTSDNPLGPTVIHVHDYLNSMIRERNGTVESNTLYRTSSSLSAKVGAGHTAAVSLKL